MDRRTYATAVILFAVVGIAGCAGGEDSAGFDFAGTALCEARSAQFVYDPEGRTEVRMDDDTVAWADRGTRGIDSDACPIVGGETGFSVGLPYTQRSSKLATVTCRFPGRFFVTVHPVTISDPDPDGSAIVLSFSEEKVLVASAELLDEEQGRGRGSYMFSPEYCAAE